MNKKTKIWLIIAASLVLVGCIIFLGIMTRLKWDFLSLCTVKYETNTYEMSEDFNNLSIITETADIKFLLSDDEECKVECYEQEKSKHSVATEGDTLVIKTVDDKSWYDYIGISFGSPKITIYLPKEEYSLLSIKGDTGDVTLPKEFKFTDIDISLSTGDVDFEASASEQIKVKTSTGDILARNASANTFNLTASTGRITASNLACAEDISINVSTGKVGLTDTQCKSFISSGDTGDMALKNVFATERFSIERTTGDVRLTDCDALEIAIKTDTGDITGNLLSEKVFFAQTDTGRIDLPKTVSGGKCELETDTGDIKITISP